MSKKIYKTNLKIDDLSASTIIRNIYESFRMLGDDLLVGKKISFNDHMAPLSEISKLNVKTKGPLGAIENLRTLRCSINYYGYSPSISDLVDVIDFTKKCFNNVYKRVKEEILRK